MILGGDFRKGGAIPHIGRRSRKKENYLSFMASSPGTRTKLEVYAGAAFQKPPITRLASVFAILNNNFAS
jgi:hypothetical protein